jgi:apolipoprotein N-acyltransferase
MMFASLYSLSGWHRRGLAWLLGICAAAALPPVYALPLLIPAFSGLFLLVLHAPLRRQAFMDGWWWGFGYFTAGLYWICISLWVDPVHFAWMTPFALFGVPAVLAVYTGLVTWAFKWCEPRVPACGRIVLFAALWILSEYLRAHLFTGFPWNLIGYVWTVSDTTLQLASVTGIWGLSWITVLLATAPALFALGDKTARAVNIYSVFLLACVCAFGVWRLGTHPTQYTDVKVRIVQANVAQSLKWDPDALLAGLKKHVRLTMSPGIDAAKLILWPETAVPYYVTPDSPIVHDLSTFLLPGALLLTGGMRADGASPPRAWNSVFEIDAQGHIVAHYDKHHLVPFGEYIPFRRIVPSLVAAVAAEMGDFARGAGPETMAIGSYPPFSPLVCYEAVFPDEATDGMHRARWLFSLTDDAWFGKSSGLFQDFEMARTRAVEQGLPLLRAANTGVSAVVDAYGRVLDHLPIESEGIIDQNLPQNEIGQSIFSRCPETLVLLIIVSGVGFLMAGRKKQA